MRKQLLLVLMGFCLLNVSCELEMSDNGKLDGFWLLRTVDTLANERTTDVREQLVSWAFQGRLMQAKQGTRPDEVLFSFEHRGDSLILFNPYFSDREVDDVEVTDANDLHFVGIQKLNERYKVLELSNSTMRLQSGELRLTFKKY